MSPEFKKWLRGLSRDDRRKQAEWAEAQNAEWAESIIFTSYNLADAIAVELFLGAIAREWSSRR